MTMFPKSEGYFCLYKERNLFREWFFISIEKFDQYVVENEDIIWAVLIEMKTGDVVREFKKTFQKPVIFDEKS